jgi:Domain of unknown function (DUF4390)
VTPRCVPAGGSGPLQREKIRSLPAGFSGANVLSSGAPVGMAFVRCSDARFRAGAPLRAAAAAIARSAVVLAIALAAATPLGARADTIAVKSAELRAEEDAYVLNAEFELALNPTLEEALQRGVPLYFLLEFELVRPRRFWVDEKVVTATTQYRLSFNALTRQYRLSSGLLGQTLDTLEEVERLLSRVTSRPVASNDQLVKGAAYEAAVRLRLDGNQLPKPFQVNALASREWSLASDWYRWSYTP